MRGLIRVLGGLLKLVAMIVAIFVVLAVAAFVVTHLWFDRPPAVDEGVAFDRSFGAFVLMLFISLPVAFFGGTIAWIFLFADGPWRKSTAHPSGEM